MCNVGWPDPWFGSYYSGTSSSLQYPCDLSFSIYKITMTYTTYIKLNNGPSKVVHALIPETCVLTLGDNREFTDVAKDMNLENMERISWIRWADSI